ncbi:MAG: PfkB family carbohydrate kinase [Bdellovibrionota bacterium]
MDLKSLKTAALEKIETLKKLPSPLSQLTVVGDMAVDRFVFGNVDRISPEAPVPVLFAERQEDKAGCAANVVRNMSALSHDLKFSGHLLGFVGNDDASKRLVEILQESCPGLALHLKNDPECITPIKTRYIAGSQHQLLRVDLESADWDKKKPRDFPDDWKPLLAQSKVLICQDYAKGLLREKFLAESIALAKEKGVLVLVDPNRNTPSHWYTGASLLTPNIDEAEKLWGRGLERGAREDLVLEAAKDICEKLSLDSILITRGKHGMTGYSHKGDSFSFPSFAQEVYDVTGAGDTVIATLGVFMSLGVDFRMSSYMANAAASVVVSKVGTAVASLDEIQHVIKSQS